MLAIECQNAEGILKVSKADKKNPYLSANVLSFGTIQCYSFCLSFLNAIKSLQNKFHVQVC